jgi:hypothetical protein
MSNINQALLDIEKNLQDLSSAREQVLEVTGSGRELAKTAAELTKKMDALYQAVKKESSAYDDSFNKSRQEFEGKLNSLVDKSEKSLSTFLKRLNEVETDISRQISKITDTASIKTGVLINKQEDSFKQTIDYLKIYKESVVNITKDLNEFDFQAELLPVFHKQEAIEKNIISVIKYETFDLKKEINLEQKKICQSQKSELDEFQLQITGEIQKLKDRQNINVYITWGLIIIGVIALIFIK